jgi:hypothetical protein
MISHGVPGMREICDARDLFGGHSAARYNATGHAGQE